MRLNLCVTHLFAGKYNFSKHNCYSLVTGINIVTRNANTHTVGTIINTLASVDIRRIYVYIYRYIDFILRAAYIILAKLRKLQNTCPVRSVKQQSVNILFWSFFFFYLTSFTYCSRLFITSLRFSFRCCE